MALEEKRARTIISAMPSGRLRAVPATIAAILSLAAIAPAAATLPLALRDVNPDKLSGGLFSALDAQGEFGPPRVNQPQPRAGTATTGYVDLSKGKPPAVLDARVGVNVRLGDDPAALPANQRGQAEPHIFRSAANPDLLLATFQEGRYPDGGAVDCGYSVSRDGGLTWTRALIPSLTTASGGTYVRATDPVAAIGPQGDMYLNTLGAITGAFDTAAIVVSRSTDNGATWTAPSVAFQSNSTQVMPDKNWLAVNDYAGLATTGRLVVTWTNFTSTATGASTGNNILAAVSNDRGSTWTAPVAVTPAGSNNQGSLPVFLPDGSLLLVYITFVNTTSTSLFNINCKRSTDGGVSYPAVETPVVALVNGWDDPDVRDGVFLPQVAVARTTGKVFLSYTAVVNGTPRVLVTSSADKGTTWSTPVVVSDNPAGVSVMNPAVAITPDGLSVSAVWMDKRNASDGHNFVDHYAALSLDGGVTWQPNLRLTEMTSDIRYAAVTSRGYMMGDYLAVAAPLSSADAFIATWCDTRTGDSDPFTVRFAPSATADYAAWGVARKLTVGAQSLSDADHDGALDQVEYLTGTDPRRADSGEPFVIRRSSDTTIDIAWAQRPAIAGATVGVVVSANPLQFGTQGVALGADSQLNTVPLPALTADQLPTTALPAGLVWRGVRDTVPAGATRWIGFGVNFTNTFGGNSVGSPVATVNTDSRLTNLSTRGQAKLGASQMIVGFVLSGNKSILIRAAGPALTAFGLSGTLADPQFVLTSNTDTTFAPLSNNDWQQGNATTALFTRLGAFPFAAGSHDAALLAQLGAQNFTATVSGVNSTSGVTLAELYDADATPGAPASPRLLDVSTRAEAGNGDNALIAGFSLSGTQPRRVLIRAVGPTLANFGVSGFLADPVLNLYTASNVIIATNDDWQTSRSGAAIAATGQRVGAFGLNSGSLDAALLITLAPGNYTAIVTSADGSTGVALVEVYDAD